MTNSQKITLRLSEVRKRLNEIAGLEGDDFTDEIRGEFDTLKAEHATLETRAQAALIAEGGEPTQTVTTESAEDRELRELREKVTIADYVQAAVETRSVDGAALEYNQALEIPTGMFPLEMLAPELEQRATTDTESTVNQSRWLDRLFADTAAARLGITMESVAAGVSSHPLTTAGASAAQRAREQAAADAAWTVGVTEAKPKRNSVRAVFTMEDAARLPGLEQALRRDLNMALKEGVDRAIFMGDTGASGTAADITGLNTANITESTITQANKVKGPETLATFVGYVDGIHASGMDQVNIVASVGANTLWMSTVANAAAENQTVAQFLRASGMTWGTRAHIASGTGNNAMAAFVGLGRGIAGAGVAAVWNAATLVRDQYTGAAKGEVAITLHYLWDFQLPRPASFKRVKFVS